MREVRLALRALSKAGWRAAKIDPMRALRYE
jgi:ABC-type lipoprotein release transport system permease subunit